MQAYPTIPFEQQAPHEATVTLLVERQGDGETLAVVLRMQQFFPRISLPESYCRNSTAIPLAHE